MKTYKTITPLRELKTRGMYTKEPKKNQNKKNWNLLSERPAKCDSTIIFANAFRKFHKRKIVDFFILIFIRLLDGSQNSFVVIHELSQVQMEISAAQKLWYSAFVIQLSFAMNLKRELFFFVLLHWAWSFIKNYAWI